MKANEAIGIRTLRPEKRHSFQFGKESICGKIEICGFGNDDEGAHPSLSYYPHLWSGQTSWKNTTRSFISKCTLNLYFHHQLDFKALINLWCTTVQTKNCVCFILRFIAKLYILALCCRSTHKCLEIGSNFANKFGHLFFSLERWLSLKYENQSGKTHLCFTVRRGFPQKK